MSRGVGIGGIYVGGKIYPAVGYFLGFIGGLTTLIKGIEFMDGVYIQKLLWSYNKNTSRLLNSLQQGRSVVIESKDSYHTIINNEMKIIIDKNKFISLMIEDVETVDVFSSFEKNSLVPEIKKLFNLENDNEKIAKHKLHSFFENNQNKSIE